MSLPTTAKALLGLSAVLFALAVLSIIDMLLPRPFDGVLLDPDTPGALRVLDVIPGSGAAVAGIVPGDRIAGIGHRMVRDREQASRVLGSYEVGDTVTYFVEDAAGGLRESRLRLGEKRAIKAPYAYACLLGFSFFFIGLYVLLRQPHQRAARIFFVVCNLFLVFLVCRLRPASYSSVDSSILLAGTGALLFLPAAFLHFFLIFPRPLPRLERWIAEHGRTAWRRLLVVVYLLPAAALGARLAKAWHDGESLSLVSGAPLVNWWILAAYMLLGLLVLAINSEGLQDRRQRRGAALVFAGSLFGLVPFLTLAVVTPSFLHSERFLFLGVIPLGLVPLTFAYAIVRFQFLDIRVILHKGLLYTVTTAIVTVSYALAIAFFNSWSRGTALAEWRFFPLLFALAIVLLFEPLRRRIQGPIDGFFFAERSRLQSTMLEMGEQLTAGLDHEEVVRNLVETLPQTLGLHFAALYLVKGGQLERVAGPGYLPAELPLTPELEAFLGRDRRRLTRLDDLDKEAGESPELARLLQRLALDGVELLGDLASPRGRVGIVLLSGKTGQMAVEPTELKLLAGLLSQAAIALETARLLDQRARQAELERELAIASSIQSSLLPASVRMADGWTVAAVCRPARDVGGDFFAQLPGNDDEPGAVIYGDVSGKSVPGALMMMAAHEVLHALAMTHADPAELFDLANRRLYRIGQRSFVALGYLAGASDGPRLRYGLAGQPPPLRRGEDGEVSELPVPVHRLPLGAFHRGTYQVLETRVEPGELILAYSDGVLETQSPDGEFFGEERLRASLAVSLPEPDAAVRSILADLEAFAAGHPAYDDLTLVAIGRRREAE
ncbi:MAG: SpoIIE family protein phosphatase [Acidobacteria bacterium]|nr:SpoIIE family protein phosphatase [Acidobacteriota bacterium]